MSNVIKGAQKQFIAPLFFADADTYQESNYVSLKNVEHVRIIIFFQTQGASWAVTVRRAKTVAGGSAEAWTGWDKVRTLTDFSRYLAEDTSIGVDWVPADVSSYTKASATANCGWSIEFDPLELGISDGWDCVGIGFVDPTAASVSCAFAILDMKVCGEYPPSPYYD